MKKFSTKLKQRVGMIEKTIDPEFESERELWKSFIDESNDVIKSLKKQESTIKEDIVLPLQKVDDSLRQLYGEDHTCYLLFQKVTVSINNALLIFSEEHTSELNVITEYVSEVNEARKDIDERDSVLLDCDSAHSSLLSAQKGRDPTKTAHAEERYNLQKQAYDDINMRTIQKLRDFRAQRAYRFDVHVQSIMQAAAKFFEASETYFKNIGAIETPKPARPVNRPARPTKPIPTPAPAAPAAAPPSEPALPELPKNVEDDPFAENGAGDDVIGSDDVPPKLPEKPSNMDPFGIAEVEGDNGDEVGSEAFPEAAAEVSEAEKKAEQKKKVLGPRVLPPIGGGAAVAKPKDEDDN